MLLSTHLVATAQALSAIAAVGARNDRNRGLTDGSEAPLQGSFRSAPGVFASCEYALLSATMLAANNVS